MMTFEEWCEQVRAIARREPLRYGDDPIEACGSEAWRVYYDDEYSPMEAWREDGTYD